MDVSTLQAIVGRHIPALREFFCLGHWTIRAEYDRLPGSRAAECWADIDYETARIVFDSDKFSGDEDQVIDLIVHELTHIIGAPFNLYEDAANKIMKDAGLPAAWQAMNVISNHAHEQVTLNIERIWRNHLARIYLDQITRPE